MTGNSLGAEDMKSSKSAAAVSDRRSIFLKAEQSDGQGAPLQKRFDDEPYLRLNPDVRAANIDPRCHYLLQGAADGRVIR